MKHRLFEMVRRDHETVGSLFSDITDTKRAQRRQALFDRLKAELDCLAYLEERLVYPALATQQTLHLLGEQAQGDHEEIRNLFTQLVSLPVGSEVWERQFENLRISVLDHFAREEHSLFPEMAKCFDRRQLERIAHDYERQKFAYAGESGEVRTAERKATGVSG